jgi:hypothetical protein
MAKASQQLQTQVPLEKMAAAFEGFRKNHVFFEEVNTNAKLLFYQNFYTHG